MFCTQCGGNLDTHERFCGNCGTPNAKAEEGDRDPTTRGESPPPSAETDPDSEQPGTVETPPPDPAPTPPVVAESAGSSPHKSGARPLALLLTLFALVILGGGAFILVSSAGGGGGSAASATGSTEITNSGMVPATRPVAEGAEERWEADRRLPAMAAAADDDLVFVLFHDWDDNISELVAFERSTGEVAWDIDPGRHVDIDTANHRALRVVGDVLFMMIDTYEGDGGVVAFDSGSGDQLWSDRNGESVERTMGDLVLLRNWDRGELSLVEPQSGDALWREGAESFTTWDDRYFLLDRDELRAISATDGETLWEVSAPRDVRSVSAADGQVAVMANSHVIAFDPKTGEELWDERLRGDYGSLRSIGTSMGVVDEDELRVFDADGEEIWHERGRGYVYAALMTGSGPRVILHDFDGADLTLLDGVTGERLGSARVSQYMDDGVGILWQYSDPVFVTANEGELLALSTEDLEELWSIRTPPERASFLVDGGYVSPDSNDRVTFFE